VSYYCRIFLRHESHCYYKSVTRRNSGNMPAIPGENLLTTLYVYRLYDSRISH
jgi:hypothetical protein